MKFKNVFIFFIFILFFTSCSKDQIKKSVIKEKNLVTKISQLRKLTKPLDQQIFKINQLTWNLIKLDYII